MNIITDSNIKNNCNENILMREYQNRAEVVLIDTVELTLPLKYVLTPTRSESTCRYREWRRGYVWTKMAQRGVATAVQHVTARGVGHVRITVQLGQRRGWQDSRPLSKRQICGILAPLLPHLRRNGGAAGLRAVLEDVRVARTDVAMDFSQKQLAVDVLTAHSMSKKLKGRKRRISPISNNDEVETVYLGRRKAKLVVAIYDKKKQMAVKGKEIAPTTRLEIRTRMKISLMELVALTKRCKRAKKVKRMCCKLEEEVRCIISQAPACKAGTKNKDSPEIHSTSSKKSYHTKIKQAGPRLGPAVGVFGGDFFIFHPFRS